MVFKSYFLQFLGSILMLTTPEFIFTETWEISGATEFNKRELELSVEQIDGIEFAEVDIEYQVLFIETEPDLLIDSRELKAAVKRVKGVRLVGKLAPLDKWLDREFPTELPIDSVAFCQ